jgi:alpha-tubulin suppressor-like RCC1 family protein
MHGAPDPPVSHLCALVALPDNALEAVLTQRLPSASLRALLQAVRWLAAQVGDGQAHAAFEATVDAAAQHQIAQHPAAHLVWCRGACARATWGAGAEAPALDNLAGIECALDVLEFLERLDCSCFHPDDVTGGTGVDPRAQVWSTGRNDAGQGARRGGDVNHLVPTMPLFPLAAPTIEPTHATVAAAATVLRFWHNADAVVAVSAGERHSAALTANGVLLMSGANDSGQLGLGDLVSRDGWVPLADTRVGSRVAMVACGSRHTIILTGDGRVFACGANEFGQIGLYKNSGKIRSPQPSRLSILEQPPRVESFTLVDGISVDDARWHGGVVQIAAGAAHSVILLADGRVFSSGDNSRGQLGQRAEVRIQSRFAPVDCYGHQVVRVGCGVDTTMFLTRDNMVLVTGKRTSGLCVIGGLGSSMVTHLTVGDGFALASTSNCDIVVSRCRKRFELVEELTNVHPTSVSAGLGHYALVTEAGGVMACGYNAYGQVGAGEMGLTLEGGLDARMIRPHRVALSHVQIPNGFRARRVAAGAFHTLFLLTPQDR